MTTKADRTVYWIYPSGTAVQQYHVSKRKTVAFGFTSNMAGQKLCFLFVISAAVTLGVCGEFQFKHHDNQELATILEDVHLRCPNITRVYTLSENSVNGNPLLLIEFTDKPGRHELRKNKFLFQ